jgi:hypothetical protein
MDICKICGLAFERYGMDQSVAADRECVHSDCLTAYYDYIEKPDSVWHDSAEAKLLAKIFNESERHEKIRGIINKFKSGEIKWTRKTKPSTRYLKF